MSHYVTQLSMFVTPLLGKDQRDARRHSAADRVFLRMKFSNSAFTMEVTDCKHCWNGKASASDVQKQLPDRMQVSEYIDLVKEAFVEQDVSGLRFRYVFNLFAAKPSVTWKFTIGDVPFQGSLVLTKIGSGHTAPFLSKVLCALMNERQQHETTLQQLRAENDRLGQEWNDAQLVLEQFELDKQRMETELLGKFVMLLNQKKARIATLKDRLRTVQQQQQHVGKGRPSDVATSASSPSMADPSVESQMLDMDMEDGSSSVSLSPSRETQDSFALLPDTPSIGMLLDPDSSPRSEVTRPPPARVRRRHKEARRVARRDVRGRRGSFADVSASSEDIDGDDDDAAIVVSSVTPKRPTYDASGSRRRHRADSQATVPQSAAGASPSPAKRGRTKLRGSRPRDATATEDKDMDADQLLAELGPTGHQS